MVATAKSAAEVQAFLGSLPDVASVAVRPAGPEAPRDPRQAVPPPVREQPPTEPRPTDPPVRPQPVSVQPAVSVPPPRPAAAPSASGAAAVPRRAVTMMRVDTRLLDDLMDQVGELMTANGSLVEVSQAIESPRLHESAGRVEGLVKALQQHAMKLRMMPLEMIADRFPRAVRDLAHKRGKEVNFEVLGKETELDRAILEELPDPLLHILRNAIDHGIEPSEERVRKGKPPAGTIRLEASKERESVVIRVTDDGRGIDPAVLRRVALERGVVARDQIETMPDADVMMLITLPGFSTAKEVTDVSGRGVGMDVVRGAVESLRGSLLIDSVVDRGTTFTLKLPLTLVVVAVLLVAINDELYALPVSAVEQILEIRAEEIQHAQGQDVIARDGALLPLVTLRHLLGAPAAPPPASQLCAWLAWRPTPRSSTRPSSPPKRNSPTLRTPGWICNAPPRPSLRSIPTAKNWMRRSARPNWTWMPQRPSFASPPQEQSREPLPLRIAAEHRHWRCQLPGPGARLHIAPGAHCCAGRAAVQI